MSFLKTFFLCMLIFIFFGLKHIYIYIYKKKLGSSYIIERFRLICGVSAAASKLSRLLIFCADACLQGMCGLYAVWVPFFWQVLKPKPNRMSWACWEDRDLWASWSRFTKIKTCKIGIWNRAVRKLQIRQEKKKKKRKAYTLMKNWNYLFIYFFFFWRNKNWNC